jgi:hypothetical protein
LDSILLFLSELVDAGQRALCIAEIRNPVAAVQTQRDGGAITTARSRVSAARAFSIRHQRKMRTAHIRHMRAVQIAPKLDLCRTHQRPPRRRLDVPVLFDELGPKVPDVPARETAEGERSRDADSIFPARPNTPPQRRRTTRDYSFLSRAARSRLVAAGISVAIITVVNALGSQLQSTFSIISSDLQSAGE